jgi:hypothetical protein
MMVKFSCLCFASLMALASCHVMPPRPWLRYELDGVTDWSRLDDGLIGGVVLGASVSVDLSNPETRMLVVVENTTDDSLELRIGPDAGASKDAIGEVLLRQLGGPAVGGPQMQAYTSRQPMTIDGGWRATFYLDRPLGREPKLGQYFVLTTRLESQDGEVVRRSLPVVAKLGGIVPAKTE